MHFFARAQLKYGLEMKSCLHRWSERPLMAGSGEDPWLVTCRAVRLGLMDGLAAVPTQRGREFVVAASERTSSEMKLLWELPYADFDRGAVSYLEAAEKALASPAAFRIDGKVVLTRYPGVTSKEIAPLVAAREELRRRHGDKFIVMAYSNFHGKDEAAIKDEMRAFLRQTDGFLYCGYGQVRAKRYDAAYFDDFVVPLIHSVMNEPEFRGKKYLGLNLTGGHMNHYRFDYSIDATGTEYLRKSLESAGKLRPDFVICCEWDEENENTFFRPVISSGFAVQRLFRHYVAKFAGRKAEIFPGDDVAIPNLIVSYRKSLVAGEPLEVEVLNVPDGTFADRSFKLSLVLRDLSGKAVKKFASADVRSDTCASVWFRDRASAFAANHVLCPELTVEAPGFSRTFGEGLWPITVEAVRNLDCVWTRQALRDVAWGVRGALGLKSVCADGTCELSASVDSPVELKCVEVLDGPDTVGFADEPATREGVVRLKVAAQGSSAASLRHQERIYVRAPGTTLDFDFGDGLKGSVPVSAVAARGAVGFAASGGRAAVVSRFFAPDKIPNPCGGRAHRFSVRVDPLSPTSVFRLRVVDVSNRVWCAKAVSNFRPSGKVRSFSVYERDAYDVSRVTVDAALAPDVVYCPNPQDGTVLKSSAGRWTWGLLGGGATLATGYGRGESDYGYVLSSALKGVVSQDGDTMPRVVPKGVGAFAMEFGNWRFGHLPKPVVPSFAGFVLTVEIKPETDCPEPQGLLMSEMSGFRLHLDRGVIPVATFALGNDVIKRHRRDTSVRGPRLKIAEWNRLMVVFDQKTCRIDVDGRRGESVPLSGYEWNAGHCVLGALTDATGFFRGEIGKIEIGVR